MDSTGSLTMDDNPVVPKWIHFFDGAEFQQYQYFTKSRDFNKILLSQRDTTADRSTVQDLKSWPPEDAPPYMISEGEYSEIPVDRSVHSPEIPREDAKARRKRTRTYVILGILMLSLAAMLVALLFHFHMQKSLFGSSSSTKTTTPPPLYKNTLLQQRSDNMSARSAALSQNTIVSDDLSNFQELDHVSDNLLFGQSSDSEVVSDVTSLFDQPINGHNQVILRVVVGEQKVQLICTVEEHLSWGSIEIMKTSPSKEMIASTDSGFLSPERVTMHVHGTHTLKAQIEPSICLDQGEYMCSVLSQDSLLLTSSVHSVLLGTECGSGNSVSTTS